MANDTPSRIGQTLLGLLFALIGIGLLGAAFNLALDRREFLARAEMADGIVSHLNAGGSHPEIAFTTASGEKISYPQGGFIFGYQKDQPVRVHYSPEQPAGSAIVDDRGALWGTSALLGGIGLVFTLVGLLKVTRQRGRGAAHSLKGL
ncbi:MULTISPECIES: DUF3592 domain-containing protein [Pseudomonas]|jgi:hypothetical protein|uniref:DUF3592 domain-containing protein n=1 Tax=Pseudomonas canavaninivorans TaxID=2842348 RepID=A0ABX8QCP1_PSECO|nr:MULTISPECIES: DUF3592 domain-containing protein [Pseudomonas]MBJ2346099.1 DUF3592 domain-containing protein [Pseudomonas canavaninivorans]MBL3544172.1 DUF3592 domain-containing protein [Pseudomonas sp. HB05]QXI52637.1 DUF3592 domain-containing protein [Pseudomonas alvandae]UVM71654.1 DUF3592 domain-containing protein [Pseudomonas canavaninivorans]